MNRKMSIFAALVTIASTSALTPGRATLLVDNGSRRAASTLALRLTAASLSTLLGSEVLPVSLRWSDGVAAAKLDGTPACILESTLRALAADGIDSVAIVPLFLGPADGIRSAFATAQQDGAAPPQLALGACLVDEASPDDTRVGRALAAGILRTARANRLAVPYRVVVVDHGKPPH